MTTHDAMEALVMLAQGWHGPDCTPARLLQDGEEGLAQCIERGLAACFEGLGDKVRLADDVLPRRYVYLLTERGRAEYMSRQRH